MRPIKIANKKIYSLLENNWKSTKEIQDKGNTKGLYPSWESYKRALDELLLEGKVECMRAGRTYLWKKSDSL